MTIGRKAEAISFGYRANTFMKFYSNSTDSGTSYKKELYH